MMCHFAGHVIKGKKMPGQMGNANRVAVNLLVFKTYPELNLMAVVGHVPGAEVRRAHRT